MPTAEQLVYIDELTGIFNRRYLYSYLPNEVQTAKAQKYILWLAMLDIDNFKLINDSYGHLFGDEVIKGLAEIIKANTKSEDRKVRYAGDEFTIILPGIEAKEALVVANRIVSKASSHIFKEPRSGKEISITISVGIAGCPNDAKEHVELIELADKALYVSKQKGKNCASFVSEISPDVFWKKDIFKKFPSQIMFEREKELTYLRNAMTQAQEAKSAKIIFVRGELGVGKSRLILEFERQSSLEGRLCLSSLGVEKYILQPYYIVGELLHKYFARLSVIPKEIFTGISPEESEELANFMPKLKDVFPGFDAKSGRAGDVSSLERGIIKLMINAARGCGWCLFIDDIQYADRATLDFFMKLSSDNKDAPILIVCAFPEEILADPEASDFPFSSMMKSRVFDKLPQGLVLERLSIEAVANMVSAILSPFPGDQVLAGMIYKTTQGNPLFVEELLKYLIDKGIIYFKDGSAACKEIKQSQIPSSVEESIRSRLNELNPETRDMIIKAAVIGENFQVDLLRKIDSEDRGYVIDLMDTAKKVGLIYEKGSGGRDEFGFVTDEVRKILLKISGSGQTKRIYSRVGEITEQLYPENLSSIAGELYYNFKKADDLTRAQHYARMVKEGRNAFYDRTMDYVKVLMQESSSENKEMVLSGEEWALIPEIIRGIYIASVNASLYPVQNQMRIQSVNDIYSKMQKILPAANVLNVACAGGSLIINNKKMGRQSRQMFSEAFMSLLAKSGIESVSFKNGLQEKELFDFISIISSPESGDNSVIELLNNAGLVHIQVNEIAYNMSSRKSKEKNALEEIMLMDYIMGKLPSSDGKVSEVPFANGPRAYDISQALERLSQEAGKVSGKDKESAKAEIMARDIQKIGRQILDGDLPSRDKNMEKMANAITSLDPDLRAQILALSAGALGSADIIKELNRDIPDDVTVEVLTKQYLNKDTSPDEFKNLLDKFLTPAQKKFRIIPVLRDRFKKMGFSDEECAFILGEFDWSALSSMEKANKIMALSNSSVLRVLSSLRLEELSRDLIAKSEESALEALLDRLLKVLSEEPNISGGLLDGLRDIMAVALQDSAEKLPARFMEKILGVCLGRAELKPAFCAVFSPYAAKIMEMFIEQRRLILIKQILQFYAGEDKYMKEISLALDLLSLKLMGEIIKKSEYAQSWDDLGEIAALLGISGVKSLLKEALFEEGVPKGKYFEAFSKRMTIARILTRLPKDLVFKELKSRFNDQHKFVLNNLIDIVRGMDSEDIVGVLEYPLKNPDVSIRKRVVMTLDKIKGQKSLELLALAMEDADIGLRATVLEVLRKKWQEPFVKELLNKKGLNPQE